MNARFDLSAVRALAAGEFDAGVPALARLLADAVDEGAGLHFMPPLAPSDALAYWRSLRDDVNARKRLVIGAFVHGELAGSVQLVPAAATNMPHRAEVQKLIVAAAHRRLGLGRALMHALHDAARLQGRPLLTLVTRRGGGAEPFYAALGYREAGCIPGGVLGPRGERHDSVLMVRDLAAPAAR